MSGAGAAGLAAVIAAVSCGLPTLAANAPCLDSNGAGGGGGLTWATTGRDRVSSGGLALDGAAPITLVRAGATGATAAAGALAAASPRRTVSRATGRDCVKAAASTAITAPGTCWLA